MAGVTGPMLRERPVDGVRFLLGLTAGGVAAALLVSILAYVVGTAALWLAPAQERLLVLASVCAALGTADLLDRTPHVWRQVPQTLVRVLAPGRLGTVWGFDIGLLFTTQKITSLVWAAVAGAVLLQPGSAPGLLVSMACLTCATLAIWSVVGTAGVAAHGSDRDRRRSRIIRTASGALLLGTCIVLLAQAL
jgi:hypothetical protein